jgi:predicted nucleic acid-binding protein
MNVFIDTNVLLDVLARREPFYADSAKVWSLAETGRITGHISAISLSNLFYIIRRVKGQKTARKALGTLRDIFNLSPIDAQIANQAIDSDIKDFEDAVQFFTAIRVGATLLITRNPKDFPVSGVAVQTPAEFLATHFPVK